MPEYPDRRARYRGVNPADVPAGTPRFDNPKKYDGLVRHVPAIRSGAPSQAFRVTTAPKPPEPTPEPVQQAPFVEPIPEQGDWEL